ncbi:hypothetical protein SAMN05444162_3333 [Paenibacillaceae bacterium GAS479]|nr:hypothetical protein SAMN05444162_3333 [Paenibacillaceae bacterium GAS479]
MSDRIKRRKKSGSLKRRLFRQGWRKPLLVLLMAGALVPAGLGYLHHRERVAGTTDTAIGVLPEPTNMSVNISTDKPTGESSVNAGDESDNVAGGPAKDGSPDTATGGSQTDTDSRPSGSPGSAKSEEKATGTATTTPTTTPANPKGRDVGSSATDQPTGTTDSKSDDNSGADTVEGYERRLESVQEQCVRDAAVVLKQGETRMNEARRGELSEDSLKQVGAELSKGMENAEAGCKGSFDNLLAEAEKADIPASDRENWQLSYEQSRDALRAKLTEQLQTLASAGG